MNNKKVTIEAGANSIVAPEDMANVLVVYHNFNLTKNIYRSLGGGVVKYWQRPKGNKGQLWRKGRK